MAAERRGGLVPFVAAYWRANLAAAAEYRFTFVTQVLSMAVNNSTWLAFWGLFVARVPEVHGWTFTDTVAAWTVGASGIGLASVLFAGVRELPRLIEEGGLDLYLPQPKPVLLHVLVSRTHVFAWGDLLWGVGAFLALYPWSPVDLAAFGLAVVAVALLLTGLLTLVGSLAFWFGRSQVLQEQVYLSVITFATWPPTAYSAEVRLLLYTVLPALLVGWVPARLLRQPSVPLLLELVGAAAAFAVLGAWAFARGLRRYESGNRLAMRD